MTTISLPAQLTIKTLAEWRPSLDAVLAAEDNAEVTLDAAAVTNCDMPGLQLLLAFIKTLQAKNCVFKWANAGSGLLDKANLLGLTTELQIP